MANTYTNASEIRAAMEKSFKDATQESLLNTLASRASRVVDAMTKVEDGYWYVTASSTRYFSGNGKSYQYVTPMAASPTLVAIAETGITDTATGSGGSYTTLGQADYDLWPYNASLEGRPYERIDLYRNSSYGPFPKLPKSVKVQAKFGYASDAPPDDIKHATIACAGWLWKRGQGAFEDAVGNSTLGMLFYKNAPLEVKLTIDTRKRHSV